MQTWHQIMTGGGIDSYANYMGGREHKDHYVLLSRCRDSSVMENVNFDSALEMLGGETETVYVLFFSHWATGWIEHLFIDPLDIEAVKIGEEIEASLEDYPVLDEEEFSRREWEQWEETFSFCYRFDFLNEIRSREEKAETDFFRNEEGETELTEAEEERLFCLASESASGYGYESLDFKQVIKDFLEEALDAKLERHPNLFEEGDTAIIDRETREKIDSLLSL